MVEMDNRRAIELALAGDEAGYRLLFEWYHDRLFRYVVRFTGLGRHEALDIVQESFIRVFGSLSRVKEPEKVFFVLRATARNRALSHLQKSKRRQEIFDSIWEDLLLKPRSGVTPVQQAQQVATDIVATLPPGDIRTTVEMYYLSDEMTTDELAAKLGVPKGTVTARLKRFRDEVKRKLAAGLLEIDYDD
jgi:RNA polymerase sigma factor (sigma-70 family)